MSWAEKLKQAWLCPTCGCFWVLNPPTDVQPQGSWSLFSVAQKPGECCDNAAMDACLHVPTMMSEAADEED